jgi:hypothetical protein
VKYILRFIFIFLICFGGFVSGVHAQEVLDIFKKPMPMYDVPEGDELEKATRYFEEYPVGAKDLSFRLRLPKEWSMADDVSVGSFVIGDSLLTNLAEYISPVDDAGNFHKLKVQAIKVKYQMTAKHWLIQYILDNNYSVQGMEVIDDKHAEALLVYVNKGASYVARVAVHINGSYAILLSHTSPLEFWKNERVMQQVALDSFELIFPSGKTIEKMDLYSFLDLAEFSYPESWIIDTKPIRSADRMNVNVLNISYKKYGEEDISSIEGRIGVYLVSYYSVEDLDKELKDLQNILVRSGLYVQEELGNHNDFIFEDREGAMAQTFVYEVEGKDASVRGYEYWVTIMAHGDNFFITTLLTPTRDDAFFMWSRNTQAYSAISKSFKPK